MKDLAHPGVSEKCQLNRKLQVVHVDNNFKDTSVTIFC